MRRGTAAAAAVLYSEDVCLKQYLGTLVQTPNEYSDSCPIIRVYGPLRAALEAVMDQVEELGAPAAAVDCGILRLPPKSCRKTSLLGIGILGPLLYQLGYELEVDSPGKAVDTLGSFATLLLQMLRIYAAKKRKSRGIPTPVIILTEAGACPPLLLDFFYHLPASLRRMKGKDYRGGLESSISRAVDICVILVGNTPVSVPSSALPYPPTVYVPYTGNQRTGVSAYWSVIGQYVEAYVRQCTLLSYVEEISQPLSLSRSLDDSQSSPPVAWEQFVDHVWQVHRASLGIDDDSAIFTMAHLWAIYLALHSETYDAAIAINIFRSYKPPPPYVHSAVSRFSSDTTKTELLMTVYSCPTPRRQNWHKRNFLRWGSPPKDDPLTTAANEASKSGAYIDSEPPVPDGFAEAAKPRRRGKVSSSLQHKQPKPKPFTVHTLLHVLRARGAHIDLLTRAVELRSLVQSGLLRVVMTPAQLSKYNDNWLSCQQRLCIGFTPTGIDEERGVS